MCLPATAAAQSPLDAIVGLRVGDGRPDGAVGGSVQETVAALTRAGVPVQCGNLSWISDEAGVEEAQCVGEILLERRRAQLVLNFVRFTRPVGDGQSQLSSVILSSPADRGFRARIERVFTQRHGQPEARGHDRRWRAGSRFLVLDDPRGDPCGGLCVPTLWIVGQRSPRLSRLWP